MSEGAKVPGGRLRRFGKIVGLGARVGAGAVADGAKRLLGGDEDPSTAAARRIVETLGELKGMALKAGQALSMQAGHLPPDARALVSKLFSQAPPLPFADIAAVIEAELGAPPRELFAEIEEEPFAGASLGQVHRARLHTGERVVVKVQYPGVGDALEADLANAGALVRALGVGGGLLDVRGYYDEIHREFSAELDYRRELAALEAFRGMLARFPDLVVPRAYPALCAGKVLTLELLEGPTLHAFAEGAEGLSAAERFAVGERLVRTVYGPFLFHGAVHGDTHPGNYVVLADGRLGVLDFGSVKQLSEPFYRAHLAAFTDLLEGRELDVLSLMREAGFTVSLPDARARELGGEIARLMTAPLVGPYDFGAESLIARLAELKRKNPVDMMRVRPPAEALLLYRALAGLWHNLHALKVSGDFRPFFRESLRELRER